MNKTSKFHFPNYPSQKSKNHCSSCEYGKLRYFLCCFVNRECAMVINDTCHSLDYIKKYGKCISNNGACLCFGKISYVWIAFLFSFNNCIWAITRWWRMTWREDYEIRIVIKVRKKEEKKWSEKIPPKISMHTTMNTSYHDPGQKQPPKICGVFAHFEVSNVQMNKNWTTNQPAKENLQK